MRRNGPWRPEDELLEWFTITYKSIFTAAAIVLGLAGCGGLYVYLTRVATAPPASEMKAPQHASFTWLEGRVTVKAAGASDWVAASETLALEKDDLVRTAVASTAEIAFVDGTVVHLRPDSLITLQQTTTSSQLRVAWHISSGEVRVETGEGRGATGAVISTPTSRDTLQPGSAAGVRVAQTGASDIRVFRGTADVVTGAGQQLPVGAAEVVRVDASGAAGPRLSLPPAPALATLRELTVAAGAPRVTLKLGWSPVGVATSYHFVLDQSTHFNWPLVDRRGVKDASVELRGLDAGRYYWRVAAVGVDDLEGDFSESGRLIVAPPASGPPASPPPLSLEAVDLRGTILHVRGRTEPGASVTVGGQAVDVRADGVFDEFVTVDSLGSHDVLVRARGIDGGVAQVRRTVVVTGF